MFITLYILIPLLLIVLVRRQMRLASPERHRIAADKRWNNS